MRGRGVEKVGGIRIPRRKGYFNPLAIHDCGRRRRGPAGTETRADQVCRRRSGAVDPEPAGGLRQRLGLPGERMAGRRGLLEHGRVLLGHLVELVHRRVDFGEPRALFLRRKRDLGHVLADLADGDDDPGQRLAGAIHEVDPAPDLTVRRRYQRVDLLRRVGGPLGQGTHLGGHDGKAASRLPGAGRFHARIEREQIGLEGDVVDDAGDLRNLL